MSSNSASGDDIIYVLFDSTSGSVSSFCIDLLKRIH